MAASLTRDPSIQQRRMTSSAFNARLQEFTSRPPPPSIRHQTAMADYREAPLATRPKTLDPNEYFNLSPEVRRAEEDRAALRSGLKRQYQTQLNNPHRRELIEDPALTRWVFARSNPYVHFKPTAKTSLLGAMFGAVPLFVLYFVFKTDRDRKEAQIKAGTRQRPFALSS